MTKEITKALCKFLGEVPSLTTMTTARIQTQSGKGFEFDFIKPIENLSKPIGSYEHQ